MMRHAWNCDLSTKPGTDILTNCHIPQSTVHWYGNRGKMYKTAQKKLFQKSVLRDCMFICFDNCTINIRVSIRIRGLRLVFFNSPLYRLKRSVLNWMSPHGRFRFPCMQTSWTRFLAASGRHQKRTRWQALSLSGPKLCFLETSILLLDLGCGPNKLQDPPEA